VKPRKHLRIRGWYFNQYGSEKGMEESLQKRAYNTTSLYKSKYETAAFKMIITQVKI